MESTASPEYVDPSSESEQAVRRVLAALAEAWNAHDMRAFAQLFAADADFVNIRGKSIKGRHEIESQHTAIHAGIYKDSHLTTHAVAVRFLRPDVALAHMGTEVLYNSGKESRATFLTLVLTNESNRWVIAAAHNTLVGDPPVAQPRKA